MTALFQARTLKLYYIIKAVAQMTSFIIQTKTGSHNVDMMYFDKVGN